ncbi:stress response protein NST1-like [Gastrolobium bilobum]|uniref:stress response protein NST1-like n=1 Tax=Gastrolobium bilobum TaxID=150636 RepID=UPI002AB02CEF|nr:stress response protein NST1-like [Gastrolobium bilobum]
MCILCVIQKWTRRVATMLPWLVIPLVCLWALSQLLPPAFRFEVTSPRLACVFVLLVTLFWYEILMPQLSSWRVRRNARLRERKRFEAIEMQKLRKTATRRCRNCLNPYRDQNPGGGRFMCSYCGHVSKRPVLDLPGSPELRISSSGIVKDLVGKSGKILNSKVWSENGWMCSHDWSENGNWVGGSILGNPSNWRTNRNAGLFGDEHCLTKRSYSGMFSFICKLLTTFFLSIRWLWIKTFRISSREEFSSDAERALLAKRGENGESLNESKGERARRKAEEKRQARLEKELLEQEERKQREEVARLVEERRRLRDEIMEAEKDHSKSSHPSKEKGSRKETEKKRQEKRKDKDKGSSKSNSDVEELDRRAGKENEPKRDFDKKSETDRKEHHKSGLESGKGQITDNAHIKNVAANSFNRGSTGTRYLDRMRGTILSSSKAFGFGRGTNISATGVKENKFNSFVDHAQTAASRRDICPPERTTAKSNLNGNDRNINHSVLAEPQPWTAPKKSWQQLFTRSSPVPQSSNSNVICRPNSKIQVEAKSPQISGQSTVTQSFNNPIHFGLPSPFNISTYPNGSTSSSLGFSPAIEPLFSPVENPSNDFRHEEQELFEDPCYVPDPLSLLGPVSESLDNFQLDLGSGFGTDMEVPKPHSLKNTSAGSDVNKPSPIESPLSREKFIYSNRFPSTPQAKDMHAFPLDDAAANEKGTWQMWSTSPLGQEGLGLVGSPGNWLLSSQRNVPNKDGFVLPSSQNTMASVFSKDDNTISRTHSPQNVLLPNGQSGGTFSPVTGSSGYGPWSQSAFFPSLSGGLIAHENATQNEMIYGSPIGSASSHVREGSPANSWSKNEWPIHGSMESIGKSSVARPHNGVLHPTSDAQSFWSFD